MRTFKNILRAVLFVLAIGLAGLFITLQVPSVQSRLADETAQWLSQASGADIKIGSVHFLFFNKLVIHDIAITTSSDTLFHSHKLALTLSNFHPLGKKIRLRNVSLSDGSFHLITRSGQHNLSSVFPPAVDKDTTNKSFDWDIQARHVTLERFAYHMINDGVEPPPLESNSIDFGNMHVDSITIALQHVRFKDGMVRARLDHLCGKEKSGYVLQHLEGDVTVDHKEAFVYNMVAKDNYSFLTADYFLMHYGHVDRLSDYVNKVHMELDLHRSLVSFKSIAYYAMHFPEDFVLDIHAKGKVTGTVSNLRSDQLDIHSVSGNTRLLCGFRLKGLPQAEETVLMVQIDSLQSQIGDLNHILYNIASVNLDVLEQRTGTGAAFDFKGRLAGLLTDFVVNGRLQGDVGDLYIDLLINSNKYKRGVFLSGIADVQQVDLGTLTGINGMGECALYTKANISIQQGGIQNIETQIDTLSLSRLEFNDYVFKDFKMLGEFKNGIFDGRISAADPNLNFLFQGRTDLSRSAGASMNFFANIAYADLTRLNIYKSDSSAVLSGLIQADFSHINNKGDIDGTLYASHLTLQNTSGVHALEHFFLESLMEENGSSKVTVDSDAFNATYEGTDGLMSYLTGLINKRLALFRNNDSLQILPPAKENHSAALQLTVNNSAFLEELFMPGLYISAGTEIALQDFGNDSLSSTIHSPRIGYKEHNLKDLALSAWTNKKEMQVDVACNEITIGSVKADTFHLKSAAFDNKITSDLYYNRKEEKWNSANIHSLFSFSRPEDNKTPVVAAFLTSDNLFINGKRWTLQTDSLVLSGKTIAIHEILLQHTAMHKEPEYLLVNGVLSPKSSDTLFVELSKFDAALFNTLMPPQYPFAFQGAFTGKGHLTHFYTDRHFTANLFGEQFFVNDSLAGDIRLQSTWNPKMSCLELEAATLLPNGKNPFYASGTYHPSSKKVDVQASFNKFQAALVAPFLQSLVTDVYGYISGDMHLSGKFPDLDLISSNTFVSDLNFTVDYTKVPYSLSGPVHLTQEGLFLPRDTLRDEAGRYALVKGGLQYKHFRDIQTDITMDFNNLHGLNLEEKDNDVFYGQAFATGNLLIKGPLDNILLDISVRPEPSTSLHIPLTSALQARQTNLLSFADPPPSYIGRDPYTRAAIIEKEEKERKSNLTLNIRTELTTDAEILLEINKITGDIIQARGTGLINLGLDPKDDTFSILGDCSVESGSYLFGLQGIVSKRFQIVPGGTVSFHGEIENTQVNLTASYKTKASINTLLADTTVVSNRRDVDCQILMSGNLMNPNLGFNIELDDIDPMTRARVESALSTDDKVMRQFVALLVTSNFIPEQESGIVNNSNLLYSNATEILSNQLNNIFVQLNIPLDVGFNYQPGQSGDLFDVAISTRLFNNRVVINGNMGNNPYTRNESDLVGNVDIELKLDEKGKFRLKAFSHAADQYSNYLDNTQRSGAGLVYQEEFDSFRTLWRKWLRLQ